MKHLIQTLFALIVTATAFSQETDLLSSIDPDKPVRTPATNAFKSSRVINGHSIEFIGRGVLDFRILHRFGTVNQGWSDMFGLDQAGMRIGLHDGLGQHVTGGAD